MRLSARQWGVIGATAVALSGIAGWEGYRERSYDDGVGVQTVGFGTTRPQDAAILDNLAPLVALGCPVLIGLSRKRIVRTLHPDADRDLASAQMALQAWKTGATLLRLHDLRPLNQLLAHGE